MVNYFILFIITFILTLTTVQAITTNEVLFWSDTGSGAGTITIDEANHLNGTLGAVPNWDCTDKPANLNCSIVFNPLNRSNVTYAGSVYTALGYNNQNYTISFWIKSNSTTNPASVGYAAQYNSTSSRASFNVYSQGTGGAVFYMLNNTQNPFQADGNDTYDAAWHHIVFMRDGTAGSKRLYGYIDGTLRVNISDTTQGDIPAQRFITFGCSLTLGCDTGASFGGRMAQFIALNNTLTPTELSSLYNAGGGKTYTNFFGTGNFSITTKDLLTQTSITTFNASVTHNNTLTNYTTSTSSINTTINGTLGNYANITLSATNYYSNTYTNWNTSTNLAGNLTQHPYVVFRGSISNTLYFPSCTAGGSSINTAPGWKTYNGTETIAHIICEGTTNYAAANFTINATNATNQTLLLSEYSLTLQFSSNTTGKVSWTLPNDAGNCCQYPALNGSSGFNLSNFQYIRSLTQFADNDLVSIYFNPKNITTTLVDAAQYYEWINEYGTAVNERILVLQNINRVVWINTYSYGGNRIYDATVRFTNYQNDTGITYGQIVNQRITKPIAGTGLPGTPFFINDTLTYWITTTREGYICESIPPTDGIDFENNGVLDIKCRPQTAEELTADRIYGPQTYNKELVLRYIYSNTIDGTYYYNTSYNTAYTQISMTNGGGEISIANNTYYLTGQNFTLAVYQYNATTGTYTHITQTTVTYTETNLLQPIENIDEENNTIAALLLTALILIASIGGHIIKKADGTTTGYYILGFGSVIIASISTVLLPMAIIFALTALGGMLTSTKQD